MNSPVRREAESNAWLDPEEVAILMTCRDPDVQPELFAAARQVKADIYGRRLVLFAPLYISNLCSNDCLYCAFRTGNREVERRALEQDEIASEVRELLRVGHRRLLLLAGEAAGREALDYVLRSIETVYATRLEGWNIRRVNINLAPLDLAGFRKLQATGIGTYQLFQETYQRSSYAKMHLRGPKTDFDWRLTAMDRAMAAGIDDVGIGVLFGLADPQAEVLSLLQHIHHLEATFGVGPHTISVPRLEPAEGSTVASRPPRPLDDATFLRIIAILRLAVPYTGIILSTRERPALRAAALDLGVSQISAGSVTSPGGYRGGQPSSAQFELGDHRSLDEVIQSAIQLGHLPSFCTACYRSGRTGGHFMELAKPGLIQTFCLPNALLTFQEYLEDHASDATRAAGCGLIRGSLAQIATPVLRQEVASRLDRIVSGERDLFL